MKCEKCGKEHDGSFGSGRFCSKSCANTRSLSKETKDKIKQSLAGRIHNYTIDRTIRYCKQCGKQLDIRNKSGYCSYCYPRQPLSEEQKKKQSKIMKAKGYPIMEFKKK